MAQIASVRGVLAEPSKINEVVGARTPIDVAAGLASGTLVRDGGRAVYRYHQIFTGAGGRTLVRKMLLCAVRLEPWKDGLVRPFETAVAEHKLAELAALRATRVQRAPLLAGYRDPATEVERLFRRVDSDRQTLDVTTADKTIHRVWRVQNSELFGKLRTAFAPKTLNLLSGHAQYEAMVALRDELDATQPLAMYSSANYAVMCLVGLDDPTLVVAPRLRAVRGGPRSQTALASAKKYFIIEKLAGAANDLAKQRAALADSVAHQPVFTIAWANEPDAWKLTLSPEISPINEGVQVHRALQKLEPVVVDLLFLDRAMPGAKAEPLELASAPATKPDAVVMMRPLSIEQISHVAELGQTVPAGSTAFDPVVPPGLLAAIIDPDEDLV